ncbi:glycosyltransferase, partial [Flavobacteriales bacterium]|nr:glycosyltransferase [Flavobacteriales bacterium]
MIEVLMIIIMMITAWLGLSVLYMLIYSIVGLYYKEPLLEEEERLPSVAVLIPAYKEDAVIVGVAQEALVQEYSGQFDVVVIADSLQEKTIGELKKLPIKLVEVDFEKSTKAKALNFAMKQIGDEYDMAMILDADNVMEKNVLRIIGTKFQQGAKA